MIQKHKLNSMIFKGTQTCSLYQKEGYSYNGNSDCEEESSLSFISVQLIESFTLLRSWVKRNKRRWLYKQKKPAHEAQQGLSLSQVLDNCTIFSCQVHFLYSLSHWLIRKINTTGE
jgi:hypothetical protein